MQQTNPIHPAPSRIVVRPFDVLSSDSKLVLPDNIATGRNTTGIVIATHYGPQSVMVTKYEEEEPLQGEEQFLSYEEEWIKVGDQVVFSAMSGTELQLPEPKPDNKRYMQRYIVLREADVIAKMDEPAAEVSAEPRSYQ